MKDRYNEASILGNLAFIDQYTGRFERSLARSREVLKLAEELNDVPLQATTLLSIGQALRDLGDLAGASDAYRRAVQRAQSGNAGLQRLGALANLASLQFDQEKLDESVKNTHAALDLARSLGHTHIAANMISTLARIHLHRGEHAEALARTEEAAALYDEAGSLAGQAGNLFLRARIQPRHWIGFGLGSQLPVFVRGSHVLMAKHPTAVP